MIIGSGAVNNASSLKKCSQSASFTFNCSLDDDVSGVVVVV